MESAVDQCERMWGKSSLYRIHGTYRNHSAEFDTGKCCVLSDVRKTALLCGRLSELEQEHSVGSLFAKQLWMCGGDVSGKIEERRKEKMAYCTVIQVPNETFFTGQGVSMLGIPLGGRHRVR